MASSSTPLDKNEDASVTLSSHDEGVMEQQELAPSAAPASSDQRALSQSTTSFPSSNHLGNDNNSDDTADKSSGKEGEKKHVLTQVLQQPRNNNSVISSQKPAVSEQQDVLLRAQFEAIETAMLETDDIEVADGDPITEEDEEDDPTHVGHRKGKVVVSRHKAEAVLKMDNHLVVELVENEDFDIDDDVVEKPSLHRGGGNGMKSGRLASSGIMSNAGSVGGAVLVSQLVRGDAHQPMNTSARPGAFRARPTAAPEANANDEDGSVSINTSGELVRARSVDEDEEGNNLPLTEAKLLDKSLERRRFYVGVCIVLVLVVGIVVGITVPLARKDGDDATFAPSTSPSASPSTTPTFSDNGLLSIIESASGEVIYREGSPQNLAAQWMLEHPADGLLSRPAYASRSRILQRYAMATIYYATDGPTFWRSQTNWLDFNMSECEWLFSSDTPCNEDDRMTDFVLRQNLLGGTIPPEIGLLGGAEDGSNSVKVLDLSSGLIGGTIPTELGLLTGLESVILSWNEIRGVIPAAAWSSLTNLRTLSLDGNDLVCKQSASLPLGAPQGLVQEYIPALPTELGLLSSLQTFRLASIPSFQDGLGIFQECLLNNGTFGEEAYPLSLQFLDLSGTAIDGTLPAVIGNLTNLREIRLPLSPLVGSFGLGPYGIPTQIGMLSDMTSFPDVANLKIGQRGTFTLPSEIGTMSSLREIILEDAEYLVGTIPTTVGRLTKLTSINLRLGPGPPQRGVNGTLPSELGHLGALTSLDLSGSSINGRLPTELFRCTSLFSLNLGLTFALGQIPSEIGQLTRLTVLNLRSTGMTSSLPTELGLLGALTSLDAGSTSVSGPLPTELFRSTNLVTLDVGNTNMASSLPTELGLLGALTSLDVGRTSVSGPLPTELFRSTNLGRLIVGNTQVSGTLPSEVGLLTRMTALDLKSTLLTGPLPTELNLLTNIQEIQLGATNLTGSIEELACTENGTIAIRHAQVNRNGNVECSCCAVLRG